MFLGHWLVTFSRPLSKAGEGHTSKCCAWAHINWMSYLLLQSQIASLEVITGRLCSSAAWRFTESPHYPPTHFPPCALKTVFPQSGLETTPLTAVWKDMGKHPVMANSSTWGSTELWGVIIVVHLCSLPPHTPSQLKLVLKAEGQYTAWFCSEDMLNGAITFST